MRYFKDDKQTRTDAAYFAFYFLGCGVIATGAYNIIALYSYIYARVDWLQALQVVIATAILTVLATAGGGVVQWRKWFHVKALRVGIFGIGGTVTPKLSYRTTLKI